MSTRDESWDTEVNIKVDMGRGVTKEVPVRASVVFDAGFDNTISGNYFIRVNDLIDRRDGDEWDIIDLASKSKLAPRDYEYMDLADAWDFLNLDPKGRIYTRRWTLRQLSSKYRAETGEDLPQFQTTLDQIPTRESAQHLVSALLQEERRPRPKLVEVEVPDDFYEAIDNGLEKRETVATNGPAPELDIYDYNGLTVIVPNGESENADAWAYTGPVSSDVIVRVYEKECGTQEDAF